MNNLEKSLNEYDSGLQKEKKEYSGKLGLAIGGRQQTIVPGRAGYVYVRFLDNLSEAVQVFNDKVPPIYDFPVIIRREGNRWVIVGKDVQRYATWGKQGTNTPFLPEHGIQHSLNREANTGADPVWVYPDQFMPMLVYPSGTSSDMFMVSPAVLKRASDFISVGGTGTPSISAYIPTDYHSIIGLVVINRDTGNPQILISSGTPVSGTITISNFRSKAMHAIPYPASNQEPLYAFSLTSGTTTVGWENLFNVRQFIGGTSTTVSSGTVSSGTVSVTGTLSNPVDYIDFSLTPTVTGSVGRMRWNSTDGVLEFGALGGNVGIQIGQEIVIRAVNKTGSTISNGKVVYINSAQGNRPTIALAKADSATTSEGLVAIATEDIANNAEGFITTFGIVRHVDTSAFNDGDQLWISPTTAGQITNVRPPNPNHAVLVGIALNSTPNGSIFVHPSLGDDLSKLHDVLITSPANGDVLTYNSSSGTWVNRQPVVSSGTSTSVVSTTGWQGVSGTFSFVSADSPSFVVNVSGNHTGTFGVGDKLKLTHYTDKYFIITSNNGYISGSYTQYNLYGGTDYALSSSGTITNPQYSHNRSPLGFPLDPTKWTVKVTNTANNSTDPVVNTWYNLGSVGITIPIGVWNVDYQVIAQGVWAGNNVNVLTTLSTGTAVESDSDFTCFGVGFANFSLPFWKTKILSLSTKTPYYLNTSTSTSTSVTSINNRGDQATTVIRATSVYL